MENDNKPKEDILEIKPGAFGLAVNFRALWRRWFVKPKENQILVLAQRFEQLFNNHGVVSTQIPRVMPQVTLENLKNTPESLIPALTDKVIDQAAELFKIRRTWLEGLGNRIYELQWCYKSPKRFFEDIAMLDLDTPLFNPIIAFCQTDTLNYKAYRKQPVVLVLVEKIADLEDHEIHRYRIYGDGWDWTHWKCRLQLKSMVRVLHKLKKIIVPLYKVSPGILKEIMAGRLVPFSPLTRAHLLYDVSLEDFALSPDESAVSKEAEELDQVEAYIEHFDLENLAQTLLIKTKGVMGDSKQYAR